MLSIGGWENSPRFPMVTADERARERFVTSCITFMERYGFEGIDLHWRYPVSGGQFDGSAADTENYNLLMEEFRTQLDEAGLEAGRPYELSLSVPATPDLYQNFDLSESIRHVDFINLHAYGFAGEWSGITEHNAPLFMSAQDPRSPETQPLYTIDGTINAFFDQGVPPDMIVLGVPFYGQSWRGVAENDIFGMFSTHNGVPSGTRPGGQLFFLDIVRLLDNPTWTPYFDPEARVPWLWDENARIAITYEDPESIRAKSAYVINNRLGGMMAWQLAFDDDNHSLLSTMSFALNGQP
jgi:chitinase